MSLAVTQVGSAMLNVVTSLASSLKMDVGMVVSILRGEEKPKAPEVVGMRNEDWRRLKDAEDAVSNLRKWFEAPKASVDGKATVDEMVPAARVSVPKSSLKVASPFEADHSCRGEKF